MARTLLIVESPAKARTLGRFLGGDVVVKASVGHVRDLPKSSLGLGEGYEPQYEVLEDKRKIVAELQRAAASAAEVLLATDPDREGEAICWHLHELLKESGRPVRRVEFHEITQSAVRQALESPRPLDMPRVNAQQARRVIDRLVGYKLSPLLWDKVKRGLSAGRVQSVALKMICDREAEIDAFVKEEYWLVDALVQRGDEKPAFKLRLAKKGGRKWRPASSEEAGAVRDALEAGPVQLTKVARRSRSQRPRPPFITSHLQQEAARRLRFPVRKTMQVAQRLYEGVDLGDRGQRGLITYMRTDSVRVSGEAVAAAREVVAARWGEEALPSRPHAYRNRSSAQDAHEAIRPADVTLHPDDLASKLKSDELRLYRLIWERFVASQMRSATFDVTQVEAAAGDYTFTVTGKVLRDPGFLRLWQEEDKGEEPADGLPAGLEEGQGLSCCEVKTEQKWTQPPPRFTEATLVRALEENGIGRPSTYANIIATISSRDYVAKDKGTFRPSELGKVVTRLLTTSFAAIINESYTATLEGDLDRVALGEQEWKELVGRFAESFENDLAHAQEKMEQVKGRGVETDQVCPDCSSKLVIKFGRFGEFLACSTYPDCRYTRDLAPAEDGDETAEPEAPSCPDCEAPMVQKRSRYGPFWACCRYPDCRGTRRIGGDRKSAPPRPTGVPCPEEGCAGEMVERRSRRGRVFFGCSVFPKCSFTMWNPPVAKACPECGLAVMGLKETKRRGRELVCPVKECGHSQAAPEQDEPPDTAT